MRAAPAHRGVALGLWGGVDAAEATARLAEIAALGATDVALVVGWAQRDVAAVRLGPGPVTAGDAVLASALATAERLGLAATVFPIVVLDEVGPGKWRGTLAPKDPAAWWSAYERFILHYAKLATAGGAVGLVVGSELGSTEGWRDRWFHLIGRVERVFAGRLIYSANWDHFEKVSFWPRLDAMGVTGYFELAQTSDDSADALAAAWQGPRDRLVAAARGRGLPLWLTEIGYPSRDGATQRPWDYTRDAKIDLEEQRRAFAALATAWSGVDTLDGLFVWEWGGSPGGTNDGAYTPRGKPAACVIEAWFATP